MQVPSPGWLVGWQRRGDIDQRAFPSTIAALLPASSSLIRAMDNHLSSLGIVLPRADQDTKKSTSIQKSDGRRGNSTRDTTSAQKNKNDGGLKHKQMSKKAFSKGDTKSSKTENESTCDKAAAMKGGETRTRVGRNPCKPGVKPLLTLKQKRKRKRREAEVAKHAAALDGIEAVDGERSAVLCKKKTDAQSPVAEKGSKKAKRREGKRTDLQHMQVSSGATVRTARKNSQDGVRKKLSALDRAKEKLMGGKFRYLNELLYTNASKHAFSEFEKSPDLFDDYHEGYRAQVEKWPSNPLDKFIELVSAMPAGTSIADFGCGDARLAASVPKTHTVHSFDLVSRQPGVIACDMAHTPLEKASVDSGVFCLSLMGTNFVDFLLEANRIVKLGGSLLVAEVESRITSADALLGLLKKVGFAKARQVEKNRMFHSFRLTKVRDVAPSSQLRRIDPNSVLTPCIYKRR